MGDTPQPVPGAPARPKRRTLRRLLRRIVLAFSLLAGLALCALWALPAVTDSRAGRAAAVRVLSRAMNGAHVQIDSLRVSPLRERLLLIEGLRVAPPAEPDEPVLALDRLDVRWRPSALAGGELHVTSARADGARLHAALRDGRWNVVDVLPSFGSEEPFRWEDLRLPVAVRVDGIALGGASLDVEMGDALRASVGEITAEGTLRFDRSLDGAFEARADAGDVALDSPRFNFRTSAGMRATARADVVGGAADLSAALHVGHLTAAGERFGELGPLTAAFGLAARADLARMDLPSAQLNACLPGVAGAALDLSLVRGRGWELSGRGLGAADLAAAAGILRRDLPEPVHSASVAGRLLVEMDLAGAFGADGGPAAWLRLSTRAAGSGIGGNVQVDLPGLPAATAEAGGVRTDVTADVDLFAGPGLGLTAAAQADAALDALEAAVGDSGRLSIGPTGGRVAVRAALPGAGIADAQGWADVTHRTVEWTGVGRVALPGEVRFAARGTDLLGGSEGPDMRVAARGAVPGLVREFSLAGLSGLRRLSFGGEALLDVGAATGLLDGMDGGLRGLVGDLTANGLWLGGFQASGGLPGAGALRVQTHESARLAALGFRRLGVQAAATALEAGLSLSLAVDRRGRLSDLQGALVGRVAGFDADVASAGTISLAGGQFHASGSVPDAGLSRLGLEGAATVDGLEGSASPGPDGPTFTIPRFGCALTGRGEADPLAGHFEVSEGSLAIPGLVDVAASSVEIDGFGGDDVRGGFTAEIPDLGALIAAAGEAVPTLAARLPEVAGHVTAAVRSAGRAPLLERIACALETRREFPAVEVVRLAPFFRDEAPVRLDGEFAWTDGTVAQVLPSGSAVGASGIDLRGTSRFDAGDLDAAVTARVARLDLAPSPVPLAGFQADLTCTARNFDEAALEVSHFSGLDGAVTAEGAAQVSGLSRLRGVPTPAALLRSLDATLTGRAEVQPGALRMLEKLSASGKLGMELSAALKAGQEVDVAAHPRAEGLSVAWAELVDVREVNGGIEFAKSWRIQEGEAAPIALSRDLITRAPVPAAPGLRSVVPEFATAGDGLAGSRAGLSVGSVVVMGKEALRDLAVEVNASGSALRVPRLQVEALGGRMVGEASFVPSEGGRMAQASGEFSAVDFRRLLPAGLRTFSGDSQVNGDFRLSMLVAPGAPSPLKDLTGRVDVTRIGSAALDRLLTALDPAGEVPAFSRLRKALILASPVRGRAALDRGFVGGDVELRTLAGGLTTRYALPRFNIMGLFEDERVAGPVRRAAAALGGLDVLDAHTIVPLPDGGIGLRRAAGPGRMQRPDGSLATGE